MREPPDDQAKQNQKCDDADYFRQQRREKTSARAEPHNERAASVFQARQRQREAGEAEERGERIGAARDVSDRRGLQRMHGPDERRSECDPRVSTAQFSPEKKQRDRRGRVRADAREVPAPRRGESVKRVVGGEAEALERPIEIGGGGISEQGMAEAPGNEPPTADERNAQHQRGIVPDKSRAQRRPGNQKRGLYEQKHRDRTRPNFQESQ